MNTNETLEKANMISHALQGYLEERKLKDARLREIIHVANKIFPYSVKSFRVFLRNLRKNNNLITYIPQAYQIKKKGYWYFTYIENP